MFMQFYLLLLDSSYRPVIKDSLYLRVQEYVVIELVPNTIGVQKLCIHFNHIYDESLDVSCIEGIKIDSILKEALGCSDLSVYQTEERSSSSTSFISSHQQLIVIFLFPNYFGSEIRKKLFISSLESLITVFATYHLSSRIHVVGLKYSEDLERSKLQEIISFLMITRNATILHGNLLTISGDLFLLSPTLDERIHGKRSSSFSTASLSSPAPSSSPPPGAMLSSSVPLFPSFFPSSSRITAPCNPSPSENAFSLVIDATEGLGLTVAVALAAAQYNIIATYRPGNSSIDNLYQEISSKNESIQLLCLPLDPFSSESFIQLATAIKDSNIILQNIIYSFAKETYRKNHHPIQVNAHIKLFEALQQLGVIDSQNSTKAEEKEKGLAVPSSLLEATKTETRTATPPRNTLIKVDRHPSPSSPSTTGHHSIPRKPIQPLIKKKKAVNHIILTSDNSIRTFTPSSSDFMFDYVSNNMEIAFASYLSSLSSYANPSSLHNVITLAIGSFEYDRFKKSAYEEAERKGEKALKSFLSSFPKYPLMIENKDLSSLVTFCCQYMNALNRNVIIADCGLFLSFSDFPSSSSSSFEEFLTNQPLSLMDIHFRFEKESSTSTSSSSSSLLSTSAFSPLAISSSLASMKNKRKINLGTTVNHLLSPVVLKYLPEFVKLEDTTYQPFIGKGSFRERVSESIGYAYDETITVNSFSAAIMMICRVYKKISFIESHKYRSKKEKMKNSEAEEVALNFSATTDGEEEEKSMIMNAVLSYSKGEIVDEEKGECHLVWSSLSETSEELKSFAESFISSSQIDSVPMKPLIFILQKRSQIFDPKTLLSFFSSSSSSSSSPLASLPIVFIYEGRFLPILKEEAVVSTVSLASDVFLMTCGIVHSHNREIISLLAEEACYVPLSSLFQAAVLTNTYIKAIDNDIQASLQQSFLQHEGEAVITKENIFLTTRASCGVTSLCQAIFPSFSGNDILAMDAPYNASYREDLSRCGIVIEPISFDNRFPRNNLLTRVKRAKEDGFSGYLVSNPHNPTGFIYSKEEIKELCEWHQEEYHKELTRKAISSVIFSSSSSSSSSSSVPSVSSLPSSLVASLLSSTSNGKEFHLIFDELYAHSIHDIAYSDSFFSTLRYVHSNPNLHVIRGFSEDFALPGIDVGMVISSNSLVFSSFHLWKSIITPSSFVLQLLNELLLQSNYGKSIFIENETLLSHHMSNVCSLLEKEEIEYHIPHAGVFIMIDLSKILKKYPSNNELYLWKKIIDKTNVLLLPGKCHCEKSFRVFIYLFPAIA
jgi:aspartate/methionine/tyrosine aminotransferase